MGRRYNMKLEMHPSGMTMQRWNSPFKTPEERQLVVLWFKKNAEQEKKAMLDAIEEAPF
jgi:hypothetical protein